MNIPDGLKYAESHEWARAEADGTWTVGITDPAQESLGEIVSVKLPEVGLSVSAGTPIAVLESVKAASDIHAPISGEIAAVNELLGEEPDSINRAPYDCWLFRIKPAANAKTDQLLGAAEYAKTVD
ncbi:glycine cleavage system protein GcvH [Trinickia mobilis]|uniref:glycine cleavage system protein GcvH n=1 Tax=Trinickia mobilis TaxID=2816356 RepID=UPI001A9023AC|nr:glycine cleavage system protein GcvH [Trinickia mobilis]